MPRTENDLPRRERPDHNPEERRDWETMQDNDPTDQTQRLRIAGGWLYRTVAHGGVAMIFVPAADDE